MFEMFMVSVIAMLIILSVLLFIRMNQQPSSIDPYYPGVFNTIDDLCDYYYPRN